MYLLYLIYFLPTILVLLPNPKILHLLASQSSSPLYKLLITIANLNLPVLFNQFILLKLTMRSVLLIEKLNSLKKNIHSVGTCFSISLEALLQLTLRL